MSESRLAVPPGGQSTALNGERKPGFGRMDAAESHSRAGRASVAVRQADERSEGTAKRREDRPNGDTTSLRNARLNLSQ